MNHLKTTALLLCLSGLSACGAQLVEFELAGDAPTITSTIPLNDALAVALGSSISATFSNAMDGATLSAATFTLLQGVTPIVGVVTLDAGTDTATFNPIAALAIDQFYTVMVSTGAEDTQHRALAADYTWGFTTGNFAVVASTAAASSLPAPDYTLEVAGLTILTDANDIIQSATGAASLTPGTVLGQRYIVVDAAGLITYAAVDAAYLGGADTALTASIPAADFALVGDDLSTPQMRTLIIANISGGLRSYQVFEITFHPAV